MIIYLLAFLFAGGFAFAISRTLILAVPNALFGLLYVYLVLPVIALDHVSFWIALILMTLPVSVLTLLARENDGTPSFKHAGYAAGGICAGVAVLILGAFVTTASIFHAEDYGTLIGEVEQVDQQALTDRMETFDQSQARFVDQGLAENRAEELLGVQTGLASRVTIESPSIQSVDGRLTWIGSLAHTGSFWGFAKWWSNGATPGYYRVDQTNRQDAEMVLDHEMTCIPSAFFGEDLDRLIYEAGYWNIGYTDRTLEVDDSGKPYWVVSLYEHKVGFMGSDAVGVLVVDPVSCEIDEYGLEDAPSWIDRVHPADFLETQLDDWGVYRHGWWNAFVSESQPTMNTTAGEQGEAGLYFVRTKDGAPAWYTGLQSTKADRGTQGYMVSDARTKKATFYAFAGVTEQAVQEALLGVVAEKEGYSATYPIPYNVDGHLTHLAVLKDATGNPQLIGFASATNRDWKVVGDTAREAMRKFVAELRQSGYADAIEGPGEQTVIKGPVARIGHQVVDGASVYLFTLETVERRAFRTPGGLNSEVPLTTVGDPLEITVHDNAGGTLDVRTFDNTAITLEESAEQIRVDRARDKMRRKQEADAVEKRFEKLTDELSTDEKRRLLERTQDAD